MSTGTIEEVNVVTVTDTDTTTASASSYRNLVGRLSRADTQASSTNRKRVPLGSLTDRTKNPYSDLYAPVRTRVMVATAAIQS